MTGRPDPLKVTKGEWSEYGPLPGPWIAVEDGYNTGNTLIVSKHPRAMGGANGRLPAVICSIPKATSRAGAHERLFIEAGTVLHETGMTPRELAEQRAELLAAAKFLLPRIRETNGAACVDRMEATIAKCEGTKP